MLLSSSLLFVCTGVGRCQRPSSATIPQELATLVFERGSFAGTWVLLNWLDRVAGQQVSVILLFLFSWSWDYNCE